MWSWTTNVNTNPVAHESREDFYAIMAKNREVRCAVRPSIVWLWIRAERCASRKSSADEANSFYVGTPMRVAPVDDHEFQEAIRGLVMLRRYKFSCYSKIP